MAKEIRSPDAFVDQLNRLNNTNHDALESLLHNMMNAYQDLGLNYIIAREHCISLFQLTIDEEFKTEGE